MARSIYQYLKVIESHGGTLVDDNDTVGVGQLHDLVRVGVVRGPVGVGPHPLYQVVVPGTDQGHNIILYMCGIRISSKHQLRYQI